MPDDPVETRDLTEDGYDGPRGEIRLSVFNPSPEGPVIPPVPTHERFSEVLPACTVNGRLVALESARTALIVPAGANRVELMDNQRYCSQDVQVDAGGGHEFWVGVDGPIRDPRLRVGSQGFAERARRPKSSWLLFGAGALFGALLVASLLVAGVYVVSGASLSEGQAAAATYAVALVVVASATVMAIRRRKRETALRPCSHQTESSGTNEESEGRPQTADDSGKTSRLVLRFGPMPSSLTAIYADRYKRLHPTEPVWRPANDPGAWLCAPQVTIDGRLVSESWNDFELLSPAGEVSVTVRFPGFADARSGDPNPVGGSAEALVRLELSPGEVRTADLRYDVVKMTASLIEKRPDLTPEWWRALEETERMEWASSESGAEVTVTTA